MLGIGMQEIILVLVVALIIIGPKKLPGLAKSLGRAMGEFRRAADDLKEDLDISGVKEAKEKLMRDINQAQSAQESSPKEKEEPPKAKETEKEKKD